MVLMAHWVRGGSWLLMHGLLLPLFPNVVHYYLWSPTDSRKSLRRHGLIAAATAFVEGHQTTCSLVSYCVEYRSRDSQDNAITVITAHLLLNEALGIAHRTDPQTAKGPYFQPPSSDIHSWLCNSEQRIASSFRSEHGCLRPRHLYISRPITPLLGM